MCSLALFFEIGKLSQNYNPFFFSVCLDCNKLEFNSERNSITCTLRCTFSSANKAYYPYNLKHYIKLSVNNSDLFLFRLANKNLVWFSGSLICTSGGSQTISSRPAQITNSYRTNHEKFVTTPYKLFSKFGQKYFRKK